MILIANDLNDQARAFTGIRRSAGACRCVTNRSRQPLLPNKDLP